MTLTERVADVFRSHPNQFIDGRRLARVGGYSGFRTRISECRKFYAMRIVNEVRTLKNGTRVGFYKLEA